MRPVQRHCGLQEHPAALTVHLTAHRQNLWPTHHRLVWKKTEGSLQSDKESSLAGFHVGDSQTSTVLEGSDHLWNQTSGLVIIVFVLNLFIKVSLRSCLHLVHLQLHSPSNKKSFCFITS